MHKFIRTTLLVLFCVVLGACASFKSQPYNKGANSNLKRISVLPMQEANVRLFVFNATGNNFGLIGILITEANRNGKEDWLQAQSKGASFSQYETLKTVLSANMAEKGYELVWSDPLSAPKAGKRDRFGLRTSYAPVANVDAQLDLGLSFVGYAAAGSSKNQPYRPTVLLGARLLDAKGKKVLYQDQFQYHNVNGVGNSVIIEPNAKYTYPNFSDMEKDQSNVIPGLQEAVEKTAAELAKQL
jgi:hypothetical protein